MMVDNLNKKVVKVQVLLSTYNGQEFLEEQVKSILNQQGVHTHILVRDDGSTDNTLSVLKKLKRKYPDRLDYFLDKNIGYKKSFIELMKDTSLDFDYFAFSDQDDFWKPKKLEIGISKIKSINKPYKLYASTVIISDSFLKPLYKKDISNFVPTLGSALNRIRLAGCTYIFSKELLKEAKKFDFQRVSIKKMPSHDGFLMTLCLALDGEIYVDQNSYILHRRLESSVTSGGNGVFKRLEHEWNLVFNSNNHTSILANKINKNIGRKLGKSQRELITEIINYKRNKWKLLTDKRFDCGMFWGNLEFKLKVIFNTL